MKLSEDEKKFLLNCARKSILSVLINEDAIPPIDYTLYPNLKEKHGVFVTLNMQDELRGCIGFTTAQGDLFASVCQAAKYAAFEDPRFVPVNLNELERISIEISILSAPVPIKNYSEIKIGEHGLLLDEDFIRALLLPQVAVENNYDVPQFLEALCIKAGLPSSYWKKQKLHLQVFTAAIFSESEEDENE